MEAERQVLKVAMEAVHAARKWDLAVDAAVSQWEAGDCDTPVNAELIKRYSEEARRLCREAIDMYDQLQMDG